ncbi:unnamed protein product [Symbiodinium sp. CCMP2592]|nr:unnamed protein product [Symbiodinium sp. CCMP2592]
MMDVVQDLRLLHLNSWTRRARATYRSTQGNTLIDHVFLRQDQSDTKARQAGPVDWPLTRWRGGGRHWPVLFSVPVPTKCYVARRPQPQSSIDKAELLRVCRSDADPKANAFRQNVRDWLAANPCRTISEVNQYLHDASVRLFPSTKHTTKPGAWQHPTVSLSVRQMWAAYREWKQPPPGRQRLFSAWRAFSQFKRAHREFRRATRAAKTAQMQALTQSMQEATDKGDVRALFRLAASLSPQKRRPRLQLRGPQGELWTPQQQLDCLRQHYEALYASPDTDTTISTTGPPLPTISSTISFPDFTVTDVLEGLLKLPPHKAAPPGKATSSSWVLCARELAPWLHHTISSLDQVPSDWRDAWMSLLPKVTHPMKPKDLRPLGITEISGRVAAGLVQKELRPYLVALLEAEPQFAYSPGRSTDAALSRVFAHCDKVIAMCTPAPYNILDSRFAPAAKPLASGGGLQLSLDLSNAFDVLPWALIDRALQLAKVPTSVRELVICWHRGLTYHLTIQGMKARISAGRGLRQGCRISPLVWSMATIVLLHDLGDRIGDRDWVRAMITAFADDIHGGELITTTAQLDKLLTNLGHLLDVLIDAELNINTLKSAFLLRFTKGFAAPWKRRHVRQTKEGQLLTFRTPAGRLFNIPVKDEHKYLGLIISYQQPVASSITHRIQAAWIAYGHLRPLLTCANVSFDRLQHSTAGLPICQLCHKRFSRWTGLRAHIEQGWCPQLDPDINLMASTPIPAPASVVEQLETAGPAIHSGTAAVTSSARLAQRGSTPKAEFVASADIPQEVTPTQPPPQAGSAVEQAPSSGSITAPKLPADVTVALGLNKPGTGTQVEIRNPQWQKRVGPAAAVPMVQRVELMTLFSRGRACSDEPSRNLVISASPHASISNSTGSVALSSQLPVTLSTEAMTLPAATNMAPPTPSQTEGPPSARQQELEMFGHLFSSFNTATSGQAANKRPRPEQKDTVMTPVPSESSQPRQANMESAPKGKGKAKGQGKHSGKGKGKGKGKSKNKGQQPASEMSAQKDPWSLDTWTDPDSWSTSSWTTSSHTSTEYSTGLLMQVARMALRHEQQLHTLQQDTRLYMYFKPNQEYSVLPMMLQLATEWRQTMEKTPEKLTMSLRELMIRGLLKEWKTRLQAFQRSEETKTTAQRLQWLDSLGHWNYMHWCPTKQELVLTERTESRSTEELLNMIQEMEELITGDSIKTFKSMRQLRESYQTEWVQFLVEIQLRGPGDKLWTIFNDLIGSAALHLLAARLRRDRHPYSGLAQSIQAQIW